MIPDLLGTESQCVLMQKENVMLCSAKKISAVVSVQESIQYYSNWN
jgi:hypothetical protein